MKNWTMEGQTRQLVPCPFVPLVSLPPCLVVLVPSVFVLPLDDGISIEWPLYCPMTFVKVK